MKVVRHGMRHVNHNAIAPDVELTCRCRAAVERVVEARDELGSYGARSLHSQASCDAVDASLVRE